MKHMKCIPISILGKGHFQFGSDISVLAPSYKLIGIKNICFIKDYKTQDNYYNSFNKIPHLKLV